MQLAQSFSCVPSSTCVFKCQGLSTPAQCLVSCHIILFHHLIKISLKDHRGLLHYSERERVCVWVGVIVKSYFASPLT